MIFMVGCVRGGVVAWFAKAFNCVEKAYSTTERELLGVIFGLRRHREILVGQRSVTAVTDHRSLVPMLSNASYNPESPRIQRWLWLCFLMFLLVDF